MNGRQDRRSKERILFAWGGAVNPDIFQVVMLICFGAAWPFSICRMLKTKKSHGKSVPFLIVLLVGYVSGVLFQYFGERNVIILLYIANALMVTADFLLTLKYRKAGA
jgi:hypothetical protein